MKSTTKAAATKRLLKVKDAKYSVAYRIVKDLIEGTNKEYRIYGNIIRANYTSGSGRYTTNMEHNAAVARILTEIGIEYTICNNSPRGGKTGEYIEVTTKIIR